MKQESDTHNLTWHSPVNPMALKCPNCSNYANHFSRDFRRTGQCPFCKAPVRSRTHWWRFFLVLLATLLGSSAINTFLMPDNYAITVIIYLIFAVLVLFASWRWMVEAYPNSSRER